jgi:hypothetical protein
MILLVRARLVHTDTGLPLQIAALSNARHELLLPEGGAISGRRRQSPWSGFGAKNRLINNLAAGMERPVKPLS